MHISCTFQQEHPLRPFNILVDSSVLTLFKISLETIEDISGYLSLFKISLISVLFLSSSLCPHSWAIVKRVYVIRSYLSPVPLYDNATYSKLFLGLSQSKIKNYILSTGSDHSNHQSVKLCIVFMINYVDNSLPID